MALGARCAVLLLLRLHALAYTTVLHPSLGVDISGSGTSFDRRYAIPVMVVTRHSSPPYRYGQDHERMQSLTMLARDDVDHRPPPRRRHLSYMRRYSSELSSEVDRDDSREGGESTFDANQISDEEMKEVMELAFGGSHTAELSKKVEQALQDQYDVEVGKQS